MRLMNGKQRGTAIFMALLIISITAGITVTMLRYQRLDLMRTKLMINSEQTYLYAQGVIDWAAVALRNDLTNTKQDTVWPLRLPPTKIADGQGTISGMLEQVQGRININNFSTAFNTEGKDKLNKERETLLNLITIIEPQLSRDNIQNLLNAIQAWTSTTNPNPNQATEMDNYDNQYSLINPAYRSPHRPMFSLSELRTVSGMTASLYEKLSPYLIALPEKTVIDTTYAAPVILQAMGLPKDQTKPTSEGQKKTYNSYFLLRADVFLNQQHFVLYTLLKRDTAKPGKLPTIAQLWQSFGTT